ncbi:hypothetical protein HOV30_gp082 [Erwinia phage Derbicus]|uniref:Uncharacterized protein n=2 Tax=Derbicusvirus derbicus TaxID=2734104 RepID=A0A482IFI3_9CAUD|nr:hypothetical protein BIZ82_gp082 [Erwinia phage vB_EamM_EarlPhillipIV]YP_009821126.1 hypothetical protein HOV30_gp082 [Erwinia phage Derbicus]ANZ48932.1 hypothetical protein EARLPHILLIPIV_82 [Erwinia phage vB_EamM_EarlPhillipIV]QBP07508.1 hypothetical protein DERBICUS_82 [Erwinia phage Derbicus]
MLIPAPRKPDNMVRIVGVDPGTSHLGLAVLDWEWGTDQAEVVWASTVHVKDATHESDFTESCGKRDKRMEQLEAAWEEFLELVGGTFFITETPFMLRSKLSAYESGVELQKMLRTGLWKKHPQKVLHGINPIMVKSFVGVVAKGTTKEDMAAAVQKLYANHTLIDLSVLDEHSIDGIAVANYFIRSSLLNLNTLLPPKEKKPDSGVGGKKKRFKRFRRKKK